MILRRTYSAILRCCRHLRLAIRAAVIAGTVVVAWGCTDRYQVTGVVVKTDVSRAQLTVSHDAIDGYMDAMVMPFTVRDTQSIAGVMPGDRIAFRLVVGKSRSFVEEVRVLSASRKDAGQLRSPVVPALVAIGEQMPNFSLLDQRGEPFSLEDLRGQVVLVTFIYTRCPLPDYCPRMMLNFAEIKERFAARLGRDVSLLTITFDPKHDTHETMARYGRSFGNDGPGWYMLTGTPSEIQRVADAFGIEFWPDEGLLTHTLQTAVLDRHSRLYATIEGKDFSIEQLAHVVRSALAD